MHIIASQYVAMYLDLALSIALAVIFRTGTLRYTWRAFANFANAKVFASVAAITMIASEPLFSDHHFKLAYFYAFYIGFIAIAWTTLNLYYQVYLRATLPFPGFAKWAKPIFTLTLAVIAILTLMTFGQVNAGTDTLARVGINFLRAVNTVDFCLVALLCFLLRVMGMPWRSKIFGMMLGFVLSSFCGVIQMIFMQLNMNPGVAVGILIEYSSVIASAIWIGYTFLPEPMPRPVTLPAESPVYRWSQIAASLGTRTQIAVPEPQHSFFLADVEQVVDKVFARHMQESSETSS